MNRRDFFSTLAFGFLALFITRRTQAKLALKHLEGRTIPRGLVIAQPCGLGKPFHPGTMSLRTQKLKSVIEPITSTDWPSDPAYDWSFLDSGASQSLSAWLTR